MLSVEDRSLACLVADRSKRSLCRSPLLEVNPPTVDEFWMLCDVGESQLWGQPHAGKPLSPVELPQPGIQLLEV